VQSRPDGADPRDPAAPAERGAGRTANSERADERGKVELVPADPESRAAAADERIVEQPGSGGRGPDGHVADGFNDDRRESRANRPAAEPSTASGRGRNFVLWRELAVYSLLRFALIAALTALLTLFMPLIVALLFAIVVQLPVAYIVFARQRAAVNAGIAVAAARRRTERARLQAALTGDEPD
jgi:hypothetical protein